MEIMCHLTRNKFATTLQVMSDDADSDSAVFNNIYLSFLISI